MAQDKYLRLGRRLDLRPNLDAYSKDRLGNHNPDLIVLKIWTAPPPPIDVDRLPLQAKVQVTPLLPVNWIVRIHTIEVEELLQALARKSCANAERLLNQQNLGTYYECKEIGTRFRDLESPRVSSKVLYETDITQRRSVEAICTGTARVSLFQIANNAGISRRGVTENVPTQLDLPDFIPNRKHRQGGFDTQNTPATSESVFQESKY
ncbi:hypothetical protein C8R47DRAFT_295776 [Mycena vitilis]|nr:hypothetical protein C8R47DRAFT_295776 [Mycena vitilis]